MAEISNPFVAKKGLVVQGNATINGTTTSTGNVTAPLFIGALTGTATNSNQLGGIVAANYAVLNSPAFIGTPLAPTAALNTNTTQIASTAFVMSQIASLVASAPATLNTLNEIATALGDDPNFAATMTTNLSLKAPLLSPTFTGVPLAPTAAVNANTTQIATTAFVLGQAATISPLVNGTAAVGTSTLYARQDHVHPTDTTGARNSISLTGGGGSYNASTGVITLTANVTSVQGHTGVVILNNSDIVGALGFTPYNATNPNSYITLPQALAGISVAGGGSYNSSTGVITVTGVVSQVAGRTGSVVLTQADIGGLTASSSPTFATVTASLNGNANTATLATNVAGGAAGSLHYQTAANTTAMLAAGTGVLVGGATPSYTTTPTLTGTNFTGIPNSGLLNSSVTIGTTAIALGSSATTITGLNSVTATTFNGTLNGTSTITNNISGGTAGALLYQSGVSTTTTLAAGTNGQVLTMNGSVPSWTTYVGLTNPMTAAGDLIYGASGGIATRLPTGTGVLIGGATPSYTTTPTLTGTNFSGIPYSAMTGTVPTWNQSTTGNAATATNATQLGGVAASGYALLSGATFTGTVTLATGSYAPALLSSVNNAVTAAGTTQATATVLTADYVSVTTSTAGSGVMVAPASGGRNATISNISSNSINVYPNTGHSFDQLAVNVPISLPVGGLIELFGQSTSRWNTSFNAAINGNMVIGAVATANALNTANSYTVANFTATGTVTSPTYNGTYFYNSAGAAYVGSSGNFGLNFVTNNVIHGSLDTSGNLNITGALTANSSGIGLVINGSAATANKIQFQESGTTRSYLQATATAALSVVNAGNSTNLFTVDPLGNGSFASNVSAVGYSASTNVGLTVTSNGTDSGIKLSNTTATTGTSWLLTSQAAGTFDFYNQTSGVSALVIDKTGNVTSPNVITATNGFNSGLTGQAVINVATANAFGGANYAGMMYFKNTCAGATNPNKYFRINPTGGWEMINSVYNSVIQQTDDAGNFNTYAGTISTNANITVGGGRISFPTNGYIASNDGNWGMVFRPSVAGANADYLFADINGSYLAALSSNGTFTSGILTSNGNINMTGTLYDSQNTGYYVKPSSTTNLNTLYVQGATSLQGNASVVGNLSVNGVISNNVQNLGQFEAIGGSGSTWYSAGLRNDGASVYLLSSAVQTTQAAAQVASYNSFRPLNWNLSNGYLSLDGTGAGASFGGNVSMPSFTVTSDIRLKSDIQELADTGALLDATKVYEYTKNDRRQYGVIAQEAQDVVPIMVHEGDDGMLGVEMIGYVPLLIAEIKALRARVAALEAA